MKNTLKTGKRSAGRKGPRAKVLPDSEKLSLSPKPESAETQEWPSPRLVTALAESPVCRRLPVDVRLRLEHALFDRGRTGKTLEQISDELSLTKYQIRSGDVTDYAATFDELVRPAVSAQVIAGVLGCLPASYRKQLARGSEVLLLSKLTQVLSADSEQTISVSELMKLASILRASRGKRAVTRGRGGKRREASTESFSDDHVSAAVNRLYGLSWPRESPSVPQKGVGAGRE